MRRCAPCNGRRRVLPARLTAMLERAVPATVMPDPQLENMVVLRSPSTCYTICTSDPCRTGRKAAKTLGFPGGQWSPISHPTKLLKNQGTSKFRSFHLVKIRRPNEMLELTPLR